MADYLMNFKNLIILALCNFVTSAYGQSNIQDQDARPAYGKEVGISIMGAIVSKDVGKSVVLIKEHESGKVIALKVAKKLLKKYPILHIEKNYIVVQKDSEVLRVYKDKFAGEAIAKSKATPGAVVDTGKRVFKEDGFEREDDGQSSISVKMTSSYRDNLVGKELQKILMQATALPFYEEGKIIGFQISQIDEDSIFAKGGFQNNDVITSVNGVDLNSISGAIKLLKSLKGESSVAVQMQRDGVSRDMAISVD